MSMTLAACPPRHLPGRGTARSVVEGVLAPEDPLHRPLAGPPPLENEGRIWE